MTAGNDRGLSRRQWLAAASGGMALLAGCSGDGSTDTPTAASTATDTPTAEGVTAEVGGVSVNQVGYRRGDRKEAMVRADADTYAVVDPGTDETVESGDVAGATIESPAADETINRVLFSGIEDRGTYAITLDGDTTRSHEFDVERSPWGAVLAQIGRRFTLVRSGVAIEDPVTGLELDPGHRRDAEASLHWDDPSVGNRQSVDVSGGWYDAGGYTKAVPTGAVAAAHLLLAYEWNQNAFTTGQFAFPPPLSEDETDAGMPDVLAEVKWELEWLARMQRPDGSVWHAVGSEESPGLETTPAADASDRYVFGYSTYGTAMVAAVMAMAARIYEPFDANFATRMRQAAVDAFGYLEDTPDPETRSADDTTLPYRKETDAHDRFWAGAELAKTTGGSTYRNYLTGTLPDLLTADPGPVTWEDTLTLGQWAFYTAPDVNENQREIVGESLTEYADDLVERTEDEGYRIALEPDEYRQGSVATAVAKANVCLIANEVNAAEEYVNVALDQIHYALGRSPTGYSYVTGVGENPPENPHFRIEAATGVDVPGLVVGGPNAAGDDPVVASLIDEENPPPAKCYRDDREAHSVNEPGIAYAAPLFFAIANFAAVGTIEPPEND